MPLGRSDGAERCAAAGLFSYQQQSAHFSGRQTPPPNSREQPKAINDLNLRGYLVRFEHRPIVHNGIRLASIAPNSTPQKGYARDGPTEIMHLPAAEPHVTETVAEIVAAHRDGRTSPAETVARSYQRI